MHEPGQGEFGRPRGATGDGSRLSHLHGKAGFGQDDGGSQAIWTCSDDFGGGRHRIAPVIAQRNEKPIPRSANLRGYGISADGSYNNIHAGWRPHGQPAWIWRHAHHRRGHLGRTQGPRRGAQGVAARRRAGRQLHRHRGCLWPRGQRKHHRGGSLSVQERPGDCDQGRVYALRPQQVGRGLDGRNT